MKRFFWIAILMSGACALSAQRYERVYFEEPVRETPNAQIMLENGMATSEFVKTKIKVVSKTEKPLVIKPEECSFKTAMGELFPNDKWCVIAPLKTEGVTIDSKGRNLYVETFTLNITGFYICNTSTVVTGNELQLPPPKEDLKIGPFVLEYLAYDRDGTELSFKYQVRYVGDQIGILNPAKLAVRSGGKEFSNIKGKEKTFVFRKGEDYNIEFVFVSEGKKDNVLLWKDAFSESVPDKLENLSIEVNMDKVKTVTKNK